MSKYSNSIAVIIFLTIVSFLAIVTIYDDSHDTFSQSVVESKVAEKYKDVRTNSKLSFSWYRERLLDGTLYALDSDKDHSVNSITQQAVLWYRKSAGYGYAFSQYDLGTIYDSGDEVDRDVDEALFWYTKAADQGHIKAKRNIEVIKYLMAR